MTLLWPDVALDACYGSERTGMERQ
uniref:Uncharacterized protein n=1 Tax=Anguilla anguilla TaxID=7936 RepID=A0A0E9SLT1_ANGAN